MNDMTPINRSYCVMSADVDVLAWDTRDGYSYAVTIHYGELTGRPMLGDIVTYRKPRVSLWRRIFG